MKNSKKNPAFLNESGFSITELAVVTAVLLVLTSVAAVSYTKYKKRGAETWVRGEFAVLSNFLGMARIHDGGYHQFLYQIGYRPKGKQYGTVSLPSKNTGDKSCCDKFPDNKGMASCTGGYLYYQCDNTSLGKAVSNLEACPEADCPRASGVPAVLEAAFKNNPLGAAAGGGTVPPPDTSCKAAEVHAASNSWCDCDVYTLVGRTRHNSYLTLNHKGAACSKETVTDTLEP